MRHLHITDTHRRYASGATLLEILVALAILSVGMLGVGALQTKAMQSGQDSYFLSQASFLADDMAERLRANNSAASPASGNYNGINTMTSAGSLGPSYTGLECTFGKLSYAPCSPANMAKYDITQWLRAVNDGNRGLALGAAQITWSGNTATITLRWQPGQSGEGNCDSTGTMGGGTQDYRCLQLQVTL